MHLSRTIFREMGSDRSLRTFFQWGGLGRKTREKAAAILKKSSLEKKKVQNGEGLPCSEERHHCRATEGQGKNDVEV